MVLGVDYYPEHWPAAMLEEDIARMKAIGVNTVRIGEFAWHLMEPIEGTYDFSYFDGVVAALKAAGIAIIFGTPTATFPAWLAKRYPEIIAVSAQGIRHAFGGRRLYCYNSEVYRKKAMAITEALVAHYREEEAIIAWQADNEIGHEGSDQCYCALCKSAFRNDLATRYKNIEALNEAYGTIFWGQTYNTFEEVPMPTSTITIHNPGLMLDWARFRSASICRYADDLAQTVRRNCGTHQRVIHNLYGGYFDRAFDQAQFAASFDIVGYDHYPVWGGLKAPISPAHNTMALAYMYGLKNQPIWVVEAIMGAQGHDYIGFMPRPNQAMMWALHALAHGSEALLFFRWRGMTRGAEQFCQGILDPDNRDNRKLNEVKRCFKVASENEALFSAPTVSSVAIGYDYDNRWSWHAQPQSDALTYTDVMANYFDAFYQYNVFPDVRPLNALMAEPLDKYRVILLPIMQIVDSEQIAWLQTFIESGGTLVTGFRSGIKGRHNAINFGENKLAKLCGIQIDGFESLGLGLSCSMIDVETGSLFDEGTIWRDLIIPVEAEGLWHYGDAGFEHYAAMTMRQLGEGMVYYLGTSFSPQVMGRLAAEVLTANQLRHLKTPKGLECISKETGKIWINHRSDAVAFEGRTIEPYGVLVEKH